MIELRDDPGGVNIKKAVRDFADIRNVLQRDEIWNMRPVESCVVKYKFTQREPHSMKEGMSEGPSRQVSVSSPYIRWDLFL